MKMIQWLFPGWWRLFNEFQADAMRLSAENCRLRNENSRLKRGLHAAHLAATLPTVKAGINRLEYIAKASEEALTGQVKP